MAFGDLLGYGLQGGGALLGGYLGGAPGAQVGLTLGQGAGNLAQSLFKQESPQEKQLAQLMQQMGTPYQQKQLSFDDIAQGEQRRFQQQVLPSMMERFTGSGGGQRSSAFRQAMGGAKNDLISRLAELRSGFDERQQQSGLNAYNANQSRMGNLANLLQGQGQQQQMAREGQQNRFAQFAGMIPKTMMQNQQFEQSQLNDYIKNQLLGAGQASQDQTSKQDFITRIMQGLTGQNTDTVSGRVPSAWENAWNAYTKGHKAQMDFFKDVAPLLI